MATSSAWPSTQVVIPGFAAYHIGIESTQEEMTHTDMDQTASDISVDGENLDPE